MVQNYVGIGSILLSSIPKYVVHKSHVSCFSEKRYTVKNRCTFIGIRIPIMVSFETKWKSRDRGWYKVTCLFRPNAKNKIISKDILRSVGDLTKQYEVPLSRMLHDNLEGDHIQRHPPLMRHYTNFWPFTDLDLITEFDFLPNCVRFP